MNVAVTIVDGPIEKMAPAWNVPGAGATLAFEGIVRPTEDGQPLIAIDYEAYEPMATKVLARIATRSREDFGLLGIVVEHSRGRVAVGECSFRLRVASLHRKEALAAMDRFIDELKCDVPIWKKPIFHDSTITS